MPGNIFTRNHVVTPCLVYGLVFLETFHLTKKCGSVNIERYEFFVLVKKTRMVENNPYFYLIDLYRGTGASYVFTLSVCLSVCGVSSVD